MKTFLRGVALAALGLLALAPGSARAQIVENGPYYALPSWDQQLPPSSRWVLLTNWNSQAVLDRETGLIWEQTPKDPTADAGWAFALSACQEAKTGGRMGWRLPGINELLSLAQPDLNLNLVLPNSPFNINVIGVLFWTSTMDQGGQAYGVRFGGLGIGGTIVDVPTNSGLGSWCVRGGQGTVTMQ